MASFLDLNATNLSYYTVPLAYMLIMVPHTYSIQLAGKNYDLANPRKTEEHCAKDASMSKETVRAINRAKAACANGFESLSIFGPAVVAANVAGVPVSTLNYLTLAYLASRALYTYTYVILQTNRRLAPLRSAVWAVSLGLVFTLFVKAGNAVNK